MGSVPIFSSLHIRNNNNYYNYNNINIPCSINNRTLQRRSNQSVVCIPRAGVNDIPAAAAQTQITWEIVVGALAGVAPFVVAGIEFNKRIVAQRECKVCKGSGLVLRDKKYYFRCPACGGFLPWQSWRRFFTG